MRAFLALRRSGRRTRIHGSQYRDGMRVSQLIALLGLATSALGCGIRTPATAIAPGILPPAPPPILAGTFGNRPFQAQSAVMLKPTKWNDGTTTQTLRIFERAMDCASTDNMYWGDGAIPGERFVQITIGGQWPMFPNSVWQGAFAARGPNSRDGSGIDISFETIRGGGGGSGSGMAGQMQVLQSTRGAGVVSIQGHRTYEDMKNFGVADKDIDQNELGTVSGNVAFIVCEGGRGG
jgi:hypothetical protein